MQSGSAKAARGSISFVRKLVIAIPANLALFWFVLGDSTREVVLFGVLGGLAGALLLTRLGPVLYGSVPPAPDDAGTDWRRREDSSVLSGHTGNA